MIIETFFSISDALICMIDIWPCDNLLVYNDVSSVRGETHKMIDRIQNLDPLN